MDPAVVPLVLIAVAVACLVSASAGYGGSLILVPALALLLGAKTGTALAALILAGNNIFKVWAYRKTLPFKKAALVIVLVAIGTAIGAIFFVAASEKVVAIAVIVSFVAAFLAERFDLSRLRRVGAPVLALGAGGTSGFSGTSGPLKGLAVRNLELDRLHLVGALALISLVGDATKTAIWTEASLISSDGYLLALVCVPLMFAATMLGRRLNRLIGERGYTGLFWAVMVGYTARLAAGI
ncbi:sulfite exporter TauE/SafE family protein [Kribbella sp. NBC_01245]|uniref:sulfite exporter TauE/SafE family protein n=1 Tax=Kribbella sp. NBC_01245 TaxID=2903578 RepID=UPI002E2CFD65|nr:sulfite exporter TauE/SafE family protein [Kribbella sp. NBC_01245]